MARLFSWEKGETEPVGELTIVSITQSKGFTWFYGPSGEPKSVITHYSTHFLIDLHSGEVIKKNSMDERRRGNTLLFIPDGD